MGLVTYGQGFRVTPRFPELATGAHFRDAVLTVQEGLQKLIDDKAIQSTLDDCTLNHYFVPKDEKYGCSAYAREMTIPKGTLIIGKIHRHQHLNILSKGKVTVFTEFGQKELTAPCTFVSEVGLKRAVYAQEETLWTTIHLTQFDNEVEMDKIESEVIAPSYDELSPSGAIDTTRRIV